MSHALGLHGKRANGPTGKPCFLLHLKTLAGFITPAPSSAFTMPEFRTPPFATLAQSLVPQELARAIQTRILKIVLLSESRCKECFSLQSRSAFCYGFWALNRPRARSPAPICSGSDRELQQVQPCRTIVLPAILASAGCAAWKCQATWGTADYRLDARA